MTLNSKECQKDEKISKSAFEWLISVIRFERVQSICVNKVCTGKMLAVMVSCCRSLCLVFQKVLLKVKIR